LDLELAAEWNNKSAYTMQILTGDDLNDHNCIAEPDKITVKKSEGTLADGITLPANSFVVIRL